MVGVQKFTHWSLHVLVKSLQVCVKLGTAGRHRAWPAQAKVSGLRSLQPWLNSRRRQLEAIYDLCTTDRVSNCQNPTHSMPSENQMGCPWAGWVGHCPSLVVSVALLSI